MINAIRAQSSTVSARLGSVPSIIYAIAYLVLIPVFAGIYTLFARDFYHSTIQYEQVLDDEADRLLNDLRQTLQATYKAAHGSEIGRRDGWLLDIRSISLHSLRVEEDTISFGLVAEFFTADSLPIQVNLDPQVKMPLRPMIRKTTRDGTSTDYWAITIDTPAFHLEGYKSPPVRMIFARPSGDMVGTLLLLSTSRTLTTKITSFVEATRGFPSRIGGGYARMLYLSTVTITTLGYGDILPLTSRARLLVALESILGIVVIGLFLNSLSREHSGPYSLQPVPQSTQTNADAADSSARLRT